MFFCFKTKFSRVKNNSTSNIVVCFLLRLFCALWKVIFWWKLTKISEKNTNVSSFDNEAIPKQINFTYFCCWCLFFNRAKVISSNELTNKLNWRWIFWYLFEHFLPTKGCCWSVEESNGKFAAKTNPILTFFLSFFLVSSRIFWLYRNWLAANVIFIDAFACIWS